MTVELEISEISDYAKCLEYINSKQNHITYNMVIRNCNVKPKIAHRALNDHKETMLCEPHEFGSNKFINYNLYKKVGNETIKTIYDNEFKHKLNILKKTNKETTENEFKHKHNILKKTTKETNENYVKSCLPQLLYNKYRLHVDYSIINSL
jgi:hypothetical protein